MDFEEAKKAFTTKFKEVGSCNWEDDSSKTIVIGTNSYGIEVKVEEDSSGDFRIVYSSYGLTFRIQRLESMHLSKIDLGIAEKLGFEAAEWCFVQLEKAEKKIVANGKEDNGKSC